MKLWICEKPAQAKLVAARIGGAKPNKGFIDTNDGKVTWCIGHILTLKEPGEYDPKWQAWDVATLPVVPARFDMKPLKGKEDQLKIIGGLLKSSNHVVIATDGDREGELLCRELLEYYNWSGRIERMWNTNLDDESIDKALANLKPGDKTVSLHYAAQARSEADYIAGMTLSRAATKCLGNGDELYSVGRVQTAVLGMIVRRDLAIEGFKPQTYYELVGGLAKDGQPYTLKYAPGEEARILDKSLAEKIAALVKGQSGVLLVERKRKKQAPPKLFSLSSLQQLANKLWNWSASETKDVAQKLYDAQLTSYPRTDCEYLPNEQEKDAPRILAGLGQLDAFKGLVAKLGTDLNYRKTVYDTSKTTAHHAIVPTFKQADLSALSDQERKLYTEIAKRFIAAFFPDYEYDSTVVKLPVGDYEFKGSGVVPAVPGWKEVTSGIEDDAAEDNQSFPNINNGESATVDKVTIADKQTKAPPRYTPASLLKDMENIVKFTEDPEIRAKLKARLKNEENAGIGTPATRDTFVDILVNRSYIAIEKNKIISSAVGRKLIAALPEALSDPIETAVMEDKLDQIASGSLKKEEFVRLSIEQTQLQLARIIEVGKSFAKNDVQYPCPQCGKGMKRRPGQNGHFWGCSGYPECKHTMNDVKGKPVAKVQANTQGEKYPCPKCGKPLALRTGKGQGKKVNKFWGCTGYPECKQTFNDAAGKPEIKAA
jgi:DNA topoisomerase-3